MQNNLKLDESTHQYTLEGKPVDGLTSTINACGLIGSWGDSWYLDRGTKIHKATELWDREELDDSTVDPRIMGYLNSWVTFRKDQNYTPVEIEYPIYNPELRVASTVDRIPLLDIKSGGPEPWHILQVAFQWETIRGQTPYSMSQLVKTPMDVYLDPDGGPPRVKSYTYSELKEAFKVYSYFLYTLRWRREKYGSSNR